MKRKRPDRAEALASRRDSRETVVKASLPGRLKDPTFYPVLLKWVDYASKTMHRGSLVFNRMLLHCLEKNLELPDLNQQSLYIHCFKVGLRNNFQVTTGPVLEVWNSYFAGFPVGDPITGDSQMFNYTARNYATMFKNSLQYCFEKRQKYYIKQWIQANQLDLSCFHSIRCAVNNWKCTTPPPVEALGFIQSQRDILQPPEDGIGLQWLRNGSNHRNIVVYFWRILQYLETFPDSKRFNLAPVHKISSHFLSVDTSILFYMMKEADLLDGVNMSTFRKERESYFQSLFEYKKLNRGQFTFFLETDGVSICFHFSKPKGTKKTATPSFNRVIAIDPGRKNLVFGVEQLPNGKVQTYKLTRASYYFSSGMIERKRRTAKWQADIREEELVFGQVSSKTANVSNWDQYLSNLVSVYDVLWLGKTGKKWARERFRVYGLKRKVLDRFFQTMGGAEKPTILFGAAKFNPTGKNELSAPTTFVSASCSQHFPMRFVDEYCTSQVCSRCDRKLSPVYRVTRDGKVREVRGLRRCSSNVCSQASYVDRDLNAALNILRCGSDRRPQALDRGTVHPQPQRWVINGRPESRRRRKDAFIPADTVSVTYGGYGI